MPTLFLEAFGHLSAPATIDSLEEDLYSVFRARSELMGCSDTSFRQRPMLWGMEEAEITADTDPSRIGWIQVGLDFGNIDPDPYRLPSNPPTGWTYAPLHAHERRRRVAEPAVVLPILVQCFDDALRRFGVVDLSSIQLTAHYLDTMAQSDSHLVGVLNWFNTNLKAGADAIVAFDQGLLGEQDVSELVATLQRRITEPFEFGPVIAVPEQHMVNVPSEMSHHRPIVPKSDLGVFVTLPEWTPSAVGWILARVIDVARADAPDVSNFTIRVTRVR